MTMTRSEHPIRPDVVASLKRYSSLLSLAVVLFGGVVLLGWLFNTAAVRVLPYLLRMKANTALAFILSGASLWLQLPDQPSPRRRRAAQALAGVVILIGSLTLGEYLSGLDFGIDQLLFADPLPAVPPSLPGRMAFVTAVNFILTGFAILFLEARTSRGLIPAQLLVTPPALFSLLALVGFAYDARSLYAFTPFSSMSPQTAITVLLLGAAVPFARPDRGLMRIFTNSGVGGTVIRRLLPAAIIIPVTLGWLRLQGERLGLYDTETGLALFALSTLILFAALILWVANRLNVTDAGRRQAEESLRESENRFRALIENSSDAVALISAEGVVLYESQAASRITGYSAEERIGQSAFGLIHPDDAEAIRRLYRQILQLPGGNVDARLRARRKDGEWRWLEIVGANLLAEPAVRGIVVNFRDVTERVEAEQRLRREKEFSESLIASLPGIFYLFDEAGKFLRWNTNFETVSGYSADEIAHLHPPDFFAGDDKALIEARIQQVFQNGLADAEADFAAKNGTKTPYYFTGRLITLEGRPCVIGVGVDIAERKRAEKELQKLWTAVEQSSNCIWITNRDGVFEYINPGFTKTTGYTKEDVSGQTPKVLRSGRHNEEFYRSLWDTILAGDSFYAEFVNRKKNGELIHQEETITPVKDANGHITHFIATGRDITERKQAEDELRLLQTITQAIAEAEGFYAALLIALEKVCQTAGWDYGEAWIPRPDGSALELGLVWYEDREELARFEKRSGGMSFAPGVGLPGRVWSSKRPEWIPDVSVDGEVFLRAGAALNGGIKAGVGIPVHAGEHVVAVMVFFTSQIRGEDRRLVETVSTIAAQLGLALQRKRAEEALRQSEERFSKAFHASPLGISISSLADGRLIDVNESYLEIFGYRREEVIGRTSLELNMWASPQERGAVIGRLSEQRTVKNFETRFRRKSGEIGDSLASLESIELAGEKCMLALVADVTERKRAEAELAARNEEIRAMTQQLWQAARLATMGELAASIAHELNNPLATVSLRLESLLAQIPAGDPKRRPLEIVAQECDRMGALVGNLLQFSRRATPQISSVDVREEIENTLELIYYSLRDRGITVSREFAPDMPMVRADRQQLRQLFLNLISNASDAMTQGGTLTLRAWPAGNQVIVEVADTGVGIPPENLPKIAETFFTTKPEGKGTGLGLSICRRIVQEHGGELDIASDGVPGRGTTARVTLPVTNGKNVEHLKA